VLGGLLLAVPDWARLSIRASVLPVVRHSRRTVAMPDLQQCLQAGALSRANIARRQMTEGSYDDGGGEGARTALQSSARTWSSNRYRYLMRFQSRITAPGLPHPPMRAPL
jgi:hypothetical protein